MPNGKIVIENLTERTIEYRVDHQVVCVKIGRCLCTKGRRGPVTSSIHVPGGRGRRTGELDPAVTLLPQVRADASGPKPRIKIIGASGKVAATKAKVSDEPTTEFKRESKGGGRKGSRE